MEHENHYSNNNYASKGQSNLNTVLGAIGTAGATGILGNFGGGLFGGGSRCSEDHCVNRYELGLQQELMNKDSKIALLESNIYTDQKIADVYERLNNKIGQVECHINQQAVYNATVNSTLACIQGQVAQLNALTKTVIPIGNVCPAPMPQYNSWTAPTATASA